MRCEKLSAMRRELPPQLPPGTELGVWKRSTGYEVILPYRLDRFYWPVMVAGFVLASAASLFLAFGLIGPDWAFADRALAYVGLAAPILAYLVFMVIKLHHTWGVKIRIDISPFMLAFTLMDAAGKRKENHRIPVDDIDEICFDEHRGIRIRGRMQARPFTFWLARGLRREDFQYLECVFGQINNISIRYPEPDIVT